MLQSNLSVNTAGHLAVAGVDTVSLAQQYGTPLYVMDEELMRRRMNTYVSVMRDCFPAGSMPLYASKAMSVKELYRIADQEQMGIDVVSSGELYTALAAGFPAGRIYFHGSAKTAADLRYAMQSGIGCIIADNETELVRIGQIAGELGIEQHILLRLTPGIDPHTFAAVNTGMVDSKFGSAIETGQAKAITGQALHTPNVILDGFHCHIGSQIFDPQPFLDAIDIMTAFMAEMRSTFGYTARVLNLGGGLGGRYTENDPVVDYEGSIRAAAARLNERCAALALPVPAVLMEPGRSIVADAGLTLYTVQHVKSIPGYKNYVATDGGMADNPRFALYESQYTVLLANKAGAPADFTADVAGRCCESGDLIGMDMRLQTPAVDDTLAVLVTGAYNYSMASNYNRLPRPAVVLVKNGGSRVVVRRETFEDLIALDI